MALQPQELADAFQDEFGRIQSTVLSDVVLEVSRLNGTVRRFWRVVPDKKIFDPPKWPTARSACPSARYRTTSRRRISSMWSRVLRKIPAGRGLLCQISATTSIGGTENRSTANVLVGYSDNELELAQRNQEVLKLNEEAVDFKLQMDLEDAVKTGDKRKMTSVLERKKKMTQRLGKSTATKIWTTCKVPSRLAATSRRTTWLFRRWNRRRPNG
jgi:hypothetical protein